MDVLVERVAGLDIGKKIVVGGATREIVGIAANIRHRTLESEEELEMYVPHAQNPRGTVMLAIRTASDPNVLTTAAQKAIWQGDPDAAVSSVATMEQVLAEVIARPRFNALLLGIFSVAALLLATEAVGRAPTFEARSILYTLLVSEPDQAQSVRRHTDMVNVIAISPDGGRMVSGGADQQVRVWDLSGNGSVGRPMRGQGHSAALTSVAFSSDGRWLVSGGFDGKLILWDMDQQQQASEVSTGRGAPVKTS